MKHKIIILLLLFSSIVLVNVHVNKVSLQAIDVNKVFPHKIGEWVGADYKANEDVYKMVPSKEMLLRVYKNSKTKQEVSLAIVLTDRRDHVHIPDICYSGQGFIFKNEKTVNLSKGRQIVLVSALKQNKKYDIYYWYTDLKDTYSDRVKFLKHMTFSRFFDKLIKCYGLVVIISPHDNKMQTMDFNKKVDLQLTKL